MQPSNPHELLARSAKADKLSLLCQQYRIRSYDVAGWSDESWQLLADAARVKAPSEETRAMLISMLRDRELAGAKALEQDRR